MSAKTTGSPAQFLVQISYCPELGIYHYIEASGAEFFFDNQKLEESITFYMSQNMTADAEIMALGTADARTYPHKILTYEKGKLPKIEDPVLYSFDDGPVPGDKTDKKA